MKSNDYYDVPIVALSALEDPSIIKEALTAGANEYSTRVISNEADCDG
jgi:PleD family two-component response regulator